MVQSPELVDNCRHPMYSDVFSMAATLCELFSETNFCNLTTYEEVVFRFIFASTVNSINHLFQFQVGAFLGQTIRLRWTCKGSRMFHKDSCKRSKNS